VWDADSGRPLTPLLAHASPVSSASFSPDGRRVATASYDNTARVWDAASGQPLSPPLAHDDAVVSASFSPDGRRVATASSDKTARVWDAVSGQPLTPPLAHGDRVRSVSFSPDGRRVATASDDTTARVWELAPETRPANEVNAWTQLLSARTIDASGGLIQLEAEELQRLWTDLRARYPADFTVTPEAARAWREREIGDCLWEGNLKAAEFHYWWLVAEMALAAMQAK
jgi:dipeptidyl aminopeptidase/acylaminoacyl peptidase